MSVDGSGLLAALVCGVLAGAAGLLTPRLIEVVPEPEPDPDNPGALDGKELYADIARSPGLAWRGAVVAALAGAALGGALGWQLPLVYLVPTVPFAVALSVIDWRTKRLPTWYLAPAYPVLILIVVSIGVYAGVHDHDWTDLRRAGFGWLVMGGFYFLTNLVSPRLVGYGDVRLAGLLGIALGFLGWGQLLIGMYSAFFLFGIPAVLLAVVRRDRAMLRISMPFGPAMFAGALFGACLGGVIADWYLNSQGFA